MRHPLLAALAALALSACADSSGPVSHASLIEDAALSNAAPSAAHRYEVTIENLTTGQPLSPGVVVTHARGISLFGVGEAASEGIRQIAENGDPSTAFAELTGVDGIHGLLATNVPVGRIGGGPFPSTLRFEIEAAANANRLSLALMLICTNDGFAGLNSVKLPRGSKPDVFYAQAYDAGTEVNDEAAGSIVPPCFGIGPVGGLVGGAGRVAENGTVQRHSNIQGTADLTSAHAWTGPAARVTVRRIL